MVNIILFRVFGEVKCGSRLGFILRYCLIVGGLGKKGSEVLVKKILISIVVWREVYL